MEHISDILKKQTRTNSLRENTDTWSGDDKEKNDFPECPICRGARIVHPLLSSGQPDYSRVVPCRCTLQEQESERQSRLLQYSNLDSLTRLTFDNLESKGRSGNLHNQELFTRACEAAKAFAVEPKGWLVFCGPSGSGKTHLAAAIVNKRIELGFSALYITTPDLLDRLRASFNPQSDIPFDEFFESIRSSSLLVLDDFGIQSGTPWATEKLDQLLTFRFNKELPTVIVPMKPIEKMDERIYSRLTNSRLSQLFIVEEKSVQPQYGWDVGFELQKGMSFISYKRRTDLTTEQQDNMDAAYKLAFDFARNPEGWIVFMGNTGCGKTHLAASIVNYRYEIGEPALFIVVSDFLDHLRSVFNPESKITYDQFFESVKSAPLLVLDDFGEHIETPWIREKLFQLINYRYNAKLPTVITTQYDLDEIMKNLDVSISSRLVDRQVSVTFNIVAPDYRTERKPGPRRQSSRPRPDRYR